MADYNFPVVLGSDTIDAQSGTFSRISDAITKGIPDAAISGALSIYNTFLDYSGKKAVDTAETIRKYDVSWGDYYEDNKEAIDLAGFVGTSFIPGALGIKALKLAQSGEALGAIGRGLNLAASKKNDYLTAALKELGREGGTITSSISAAKRAQLSWAVADNVLTSAAAELAIAATMNDSPIFDGQDYKDFAINIAFGAGFGGVVGGLLEAGASRGILKQAQFKIEASRREFDTVSDVTKFGLKKADEVLLFTENILKLPDDAWDTPFKFNYDGKARSLVLDTSEAFKKIKSRTEKAAFDTLALKLNELAEGGEVTGQAMFKFIGDTIKKGRDAGQGTDDVIDSVRGYLQNVKRIIPVTQDLAENVAPKQFFINNEPTNMGDIFAEIRTPKTGKQAYYLKTDDLAKIKFGSVARIGYDSADEMFADGYDAVFTRQGRIAINPKSQVVSKTPDLALNNKYFLDLETGSITPNAPVVGADLLKRGSDFAHSPNAVRIGKQEFKQEASLATQLDPKLSLQQTTRFMWAKNLEDTAFKNRTIEWTDFALLDRAKLLPGTYTNSDIVKVKLADGRLIPLSDVTSVPEFVNQLKMEFLQGELGSKVQGYDTRYLSNTVNVSREWVEDAISSNFANSRQLLAESRDLNAYFNPQTVQIEYDLKAAQLATQGTDAVEGLGPNYKSTAMLGHQYNLQIRQNIQNNAAGSVLGEDFDRFMDAGQNLSRQVSERGAGASIGGASNADYGRQAELFVQDTGKQTALVAQKWRDQTIGALNPYIAAIRDSKEAAAELGVLTTALRRDARKYYLVTEDLEEGVAGRLVDREAVKIFEYGNADSLDDVIAGLQNNSSPGEKIRGEYVIKDKKVVDFLDNSGKLNSERVQKSTVLDNAAGLGRELDARVVYVPPVDTRRYPFFAFIVAKEKVGLNTDVAMITAKSAEDLRNLSKTVGEDYEIVFKEDTKRFFKAKGQYDYSQQINESQINSALQKKGILGDFFPETRGENVLEDYVRWHGNSSDNLVRKAVQVKSRQFFNDMQWLAKEFDAAGTSSVNGLSLLRRETQNPFQDYIKTALNISKQSEYPLLDSLNEFVDRIGTTMYSGLDKLWAEFRGSKGKDIVSLQAANKLMQDAGLGGGYETMEQYLLANDKYPRNLIKDTFQKANFWLATTTLRFDFVNPLINIISTPIMLGTELASLRTLVGNDSELAGKLTALQSIKVPGQAQAVPSTTKLIGNAINNFFGKDKLALLERYRTNGDIRDASFFYHETLDDLAYRPGRKVTEWNQKVDAAVEKGAKITGSNFADEMTRFISADVMRQLSEPLVEAGKLTLKEQNAYISSFVNRVQGNYISSQRPIVFQGTTGAAVGLFQTYAFNVLQQLFRHVENADKRAVLTFAGLQTSIYGMNGLPFFDAINQHLIGSASGNVEHKDAYSALPAANKELGDWMLYGTASALPLFGEKAPSLYSRGDINPRHISILSINPLDIPAVSASIKLAGSIAGFGKQVAQGADLSSSFLQALEHQGWNRPLAGFAQVLAGQTTTGKGSLISAANDMETTSMLARIPERLVNFGGVQRIMGARPMDEAVALNNLYRNKSYDAMDRARIEALGQAVKTKLYNNQMPDAEEMDEFMSKYQQSGGRIENFSSSLQRWMKDANNSVVNQMAQHLGASSGKKQMNLMGGKYLQDYNSLANEPIEPTE
jgi:hypothetical protein